MYVTLYMCPCVYVLMYVSLCVCSLDICVLVCVSLYISDRQKEESTFEDSEHLCEDNEHLFKDNEHLPQYLTHTCPAISYDDVTHHMMM